MLEGEDSQKWLSVVSYTVYATQSGIPCLGILNLRFYVTTVCTLWVWFTFCWITFSITVRCVTLRLFDRVSSACSATSSASIVTSSAFYRVIDNCIRSRANNQSKLLKSVYHPVWLTTYEQHIINLCIKCGCPGSISNFEWILIHSHWFNLLTFK